MEFLKSFLPWTDTYKIKKGMEFSKHCIRTDINEKFPLDFQAERNKTSLNAYLELERKIKNKTIVSYRELSELADNISPGLSNVDSIQYMIRAVGLKKSITYK